MIKKLFLTAALTTLTLSTAFSAVNITASGSLVNVGSNSSLDDLDLQGGSGMTLSAWIYPRSGGVGNTVGGIFNKSATGLDSGHLRFIMSTNTNPGVIRFLKSYSGGDLDTETGANAAPYNQWTHVAVTWPGTSTASNVTFYANGEVIAHAANSNGVTTKNADAALSMTIGNLGDGSRPFDGLIQDAAVWNVVLTQDEIRQLALSRVSGMPLQIRPSALKGYWPLNECSNKSACTSYFDRKLNNNGTGTSVFSEANSYLSNA